MTFKPPSDNIKAWLFLSAVWTCELGKEMSVSPSEAPPTCTGWYGEHGSRASGFSQMRRSCPHFTCHPSVSAASLGHLQMLLVLITHHTSYKSLKCRELSILRTGLTLQEIHLFTFWPRVWQLTYSLALHEDSEQKKNSQPRGAGQARRTLSICCSISFLF